MGYSLSVKLDLDRLPTDIDFLHQLIRDLAGTLEQNAGEIERLQIELARLLRRAGYGRKGERWTDGQQTLFEDVLKKALEDQPAPEAKDEEQAKKPKRKGRRKPPKLPRERVEHTDPEVEDGARCCDKCGGALTRIGFADGAHQLEYIPAQFKVLEHKLAKYACKCADCRGTMVTASPPPQPIDRCLAAPGLLAHVIISKYGDHLPLYRQEKILQRSGLRVSRQTLCGWVMSAADALTSIVGAMRDDVLRSHVIQTDDVRIPVLAPGTGSTTNGHLWPYLGDAAHPHVVFDYTPTREGIGPRTFLADFGGRYLQADAYTGFDAIFADGQVLEVGCMAHCRRKFIEAEGDFPTEAGEVLDMIKALYAVERAAAKAASADRAPPLTELRLAMREQHARPIMQRLGAWLDLHHGQYRPTSALHEATRYATNQWKALNRFLEDGALTIDNNRAERALRRVAVGRKNWLFAGSDGGGGAAAIHFSLIASCELHGVDPFEYYRDVLGKLHSHTPQQLTPAAWATERRAAVDVEASEAVAA